MEYLEIRTGDIPGVTVKEDGAWCEVNGRYYRVIGVLPRNKEYGIVPVLDIPQMSDEQWMELTREHPAGMTAKA